jgi:hypothetical protein
MSLQALTYTVEFVSPVWHSGATVFFTSWLRFVAPLCQTGLTNSTVYVKAWKDIPPHTLPEASNAFFTSSNVTFTEKKNTLKARYGTLWNKKIAYRHRTAYMEGQGIARDTHRPLCRDADSIGRILGNCTHSEVKKVYIFRHDKAMRPIMKEIKNGSLGNFYCTADVGTAVAMEALGAQSKRLPEWLITPNTMQKCDFFPENKQKVRPDCMIVDITNNEIDGALKKRTRNGDINIPTQINSRPRKIWLVELGYSSDTRYMDKVTEKKEQHAELCKLLATEGYNVVLLPVVLGSAVTLFKCLERQQTTWTSPMPEKRNYTASYILTAYTVCRTLCPNADTWRDKSQHQNQGEG